MEEIIFQGRNPEGKYFVLYGDKQQLKTWADQFLNWQPSEDGDDEYDLENCDKDTSGEHFSMEERKDNIAELQTVLDNIENGGFIQYFLKLPRKKNNSLAKNRVVRIWRGNTFQQLWEDSYGFYGPELRLKSFDDYKARLELTGNVEKY